MRVILFLLLAFINTVQAGPVFNRFLAAEKSYTWHYGRPLDKWGFKTVGDFKWIAPGSTVAGSVFEIKQTRRFPLAVRVEVSQILGPASFFDKKHGLIVHGVLTTALEEGEEYPLPIRGRIVGVCAGLRVHTFENKIYRVPEFILELVPSGAVAKKRSLKERADIEIKAETSVLEVRKEM